MRPISIIQRTALACIAVLIGLPFPLYSQPLSTPVRYLEMCDASAGVALNATMFAVANDEDNIIRVYPAGRGAAPLVKVDLTRFLGVEREKKPETDFEGASWLGDHVFWITSHGRNKEGKYRPARHRFFATQVVTNGPIPTLFPVGSPYKSLLNDLAQDENLKPFHLLAASTLPPKSPGGFNIEGLCATPDGHLLIGFRNPIPKGRALLVPMSNPTEVALQGRPAQFGEPILLDLDGLGIRDIVRWQGRYLIIAGRSNSGGRSRLYQWKGPGDEPKHIRPLNLGNLNPEAVIAYPEPENRIQILSDDGTLAIQGIECKQLSSPSARAFRGIWVSVDPRF